MKIVKKIIKIILTVIIFIASFILIDGFCARFLKTRPLLAKKEIVESGIVKAGVVYKSLFADIYYCNTTIQTYDDDDNLIQNDTTIRYYKEKNSDFSCPIWINERNEILEKYQKLAEGKENLEFMKPYAEGLYKSQFHKYSYNSKLNIFAYNFNGFYRITDKTYHDYYLFDTTDFNKDPIKLELPGFDTQWEVFQVSYSKDGDTMFFYYSCGYRENYATDDQKYTKEECNKEKDKFGIYAYKVNGINDYTFLNFLSEEDANIFTAEYPQTYFVINKVIDKENIVLKYVVTRNKQIESIKEVYYVWNITDNSLKEYHE